MSLSIGTMAVGFSATPVSPGERTRQCLGRNLEASKQGMLTLTQASGRVPFGVVPFHLFVLLPTEHRVSSLSSRRGNLRNPTLQRSSTPTRDYRCGAELLPAGLVAGALS